MSKASDFFAGVADKVESEKIKGMNVIYQFNVTGDEGGEWNVKVADDTVQVAEGVADSPNITLTMDAENFEALIEGKLNGQTAFLTGKLKIQGDMTLAMKLQSIFSLG